MPEKREPVRCQKCGNEVVTLYLVSGYMPRCKSTECWSGPVCETREKALDAWDEMMGDGWVKGPPDVSGLYLATIRLSISEAVSDDSPVQAIYFHSHDRDIGPFCTIGGSNGEPTNIERVLAHKILSAPYQPPEGEDAP